MKKLTKFRLINWHYFQNIEVKFGMINFLTGVTAAGKSTMIDAMQVILLGDTLGRSFNKAANEKSSRTLKGYLRCEVGDNPDGSTRYLRNGRFTSYIAMEFYDDVAEHPFSIGIVFDVFDDGSEQHKFFYLDDGFPENHFIEDKIPLSYKSLAEYLQVNSPGKYTFFDTSVRYREMIKEKFGNLKDKYFSLFKKAVSFQPISDIEQFITEYVCDVPSQINIDSMNENIKSYERLKIQADDMRIKIAALEKIQAVYSKIVEKRNEQNLASYISKRTNLEIIRQRIDNLHKEKFSCEARIQEIEQEIIEIDTQINDLNNSKERLIAHKFSNDSYKLNQELENAYEESKRKMEEIQSRLNSLYKNIAVYCNQFYGYATKVNVLADKARENIDDASLDDSLKHLSLESINLIRKLDELKDAITSYSLTEDDFKVFSKAIIDFKNVMIEEYAVVRNIVGKIINQLSQQKQILQTSSSGKYYDEAFLRVKNQLSIALEDHFHKKVDVSVYADLVDIKDKSWTNAIEAYIYSQKIYMFVDDEYYLYANKILPSIMRNNRFTRTGLVDSRKLREKNFISSQDSLAEEIITDHQGARDYTNYLLGNLKKCDTFEEARESGRGILKTCQGYQNFTSFYFDEGRYRYPLIGRKVTKEDREKRLRSLEKESLSLEALKELNDTLALSKSMEVMSTSEQQMCIEGLSSGFLLDNLKKNVEQYRKEIEDNSSQDIKTIDNKIKNIDSDISTLNKRKEELITEKGSLDNQIKNIQEDRLKQETQRQVDIDNEINDSFDHDFIEGVCKTTYDQEILTSNIPSIRAKYDEIYSKAQYSLRNLKEEIKDLRTTYVVTNKLSYDISKEDNSDFDNELYHLREIELPKYLIQIQDAYDKAVSEFKNDFIVKLRTSIVEARIQINELNQALKDFKFGNDVFEFTVSPNPQYIDYYNMITDETLLEGGIDDSQFLAKYQDVMDSLFRLISDDGGSKDRSGKVEQNILKYTDFKSYLFFDLKIKKPDGSINSLSRNIKKASGGETQTPFYISILASFSQLYRVNSSPSLSNCIRLVLFDEAFSKMDRNRIIESIKILKDFGLQAIISAPPEKVNDISSLVDSNLTVTRTNNISHVDSFVYKE